MKYVMNFLDIELDLEEVKICLREKEVIIKNEPIKPINQFDIYNYLCNVAQIARMSYDMSVPYKDRDEQTVLMVSPLNADYAIMLAIFLRKELGYAPGILILGKDTKPYYGFIFPEKY